MTAIDVIMMATPHIDYYAQTTQANWQAYCDRHGYAFSCTRTQLIEDMHIVWSRVEMARRHLDSTQADWVFMVDADTIVNRPDMPLTALIDRYGTSKDLIVSEDCSRRFGIPIPLSLKAPLMSRSLRPPNMGFIGFRVTDFCRQLTQDWLDMGRGKHADIADVFPREQAVFCVGLLPQRRSHIAIIGDEVMRVGISPALDGWSMNDRNAFVHHDKRLTNFESA